MEGVDGVINCLPGLFWSLHKLLSTVQAVLDDTCEGTVGLT